MKHVRLYIFLYFTAGWLLDVVYRCLDRVTRNQPPQWADRSIEQATGFYLAMALLPWIFFVTRRFPITGSFKSFVAHLGGVICYSLVHTSLMWGSRLILFPLFGLPLRRLAREDQLVLGASPRGVLDHIHRTFG